MTDRQPQSTPAIDAGKPLTLNYAAQSTGAPAWVWVIIAFYLMLVAALLVTPIWLRSSVSLNGTLILGAVVCVLILCGLALLWIPVRVARGRPVARRSILIPIAAAGLLLGGLVLGGGWALAELCAPEVRVTYGGSGMEHTPSNNTLWAIAAAAGAVWIAWLVIFAIVTRRRNPTGLGMTLHRALIAGSLLELLVAVPAHIIVRQRNECCAGIFTGIGICLGIAIAIIAFGPAVFLLYHRRCRQIAVPPPLRSEARVIGEKKREEER
jgi:hypothetical protein